MESRRWTFSVNYWNVCFLSLIQYCYKVASDNSTVGPTSKVCMTIAMIFVWRCFGDYHMLEYLNEISDISV